MPKRSELQNIVLLGAGPIVIGQACEFDYSGTQACKALREDGYRVVLINSNPATIMTDPETADATYIEPVTPGSVRAVLGKELADHPGEHFSMLPTMGGQVALNVALALSASGYLEDKGIDLLGTQSDVIRKAEDREMFRDAMQGIGIECARSVQVRSLAEGRTALERIGLPAILRPSFTLGGTGGGITNTVEEFSKLLAVGLDASPASSVLIEESLLGWREYELEVMRDLADNAIVICSIENIDPMGVHTGDSITVAPALTLTDKEYQVMRNRAIACLREVGVETGGSNVQFAVDPATGRQVLIEMNPRVSRSSALASKATGFPIARVAAKLAVGYTLNEITNEITGTTPASFEPAIDYVVTKIPRFDFAKFPLTTAVLDTQMKSVGEVMSIGRNFAQSMQKALRSLETGLTGYDEVAADLDDAAQSAPRSSPFTRSSSRLRMVRMRTGVSWFLARNLLSTSRPSRPGRHRSRVTRSYCSVPRTELAMSPSATASTQWSMARSACSRLSRRLGLSSTTRSFIGTLRRGIRRHRSTASSPTAPLHHRPIVSNHAGTRKHRSLRRPFRGGLSAHGPSVAAA